MDLMISCGTVLNAWPFVIPDNCFIATRTIAAMITIARKIPISAYRAAEPGDSVDADVLALLAWSNRYPITPRTTTNATNSSINSARNDAALLRLCSAFMAKLILVVSVYKYSPIFRLKISAIYILSSVNLRQYVGK